MLFSKALFFRGKQSQNLMQIRIFYWIFIKDFLKIFPSNCVFRLNAQRFNAYLWIFTRKNRLKSCIFCNFLNWFFASFLKFSGVREAPPRDPLRGRPNPLTFPYFFPLYSNVCSSIFISIPHYANPEFSSLAKTGQFFEFDRGDFPSKRCIL